MSDAKVTAEPGCIDAELVPFDTRHFKVNQIELVTAILAELSRQLPGMTMAQCDLNTIIGAANQVKASIDSRCIEVHEKR